MMPNFIIVGAAKSGTTSLYEYLCQHPDVYMSPLKETNYFAFDGRRPRFGGPDGAVFNRDSVYLLEDYERLFADRRAQTAIGEASPRYLFTAGTARRIANRIPEVRIVAILRNPVDRAFSAFSMRKRDGWEPCDSFEAALDEEPKRLREDWASGIYLQRGFYAQQLQEYYREFPRERVRVYLYDDLVAEPRELLADLFGFLGVDDAFVPDLSLRYNVSGVIRSPTLRFLWTRTHPIQALVRPLLPKAVRQTIARRFVGLEKERLHLSGETRRRLQALYQEEICRLQGLIERDLSAWLRT